MQAPSPRARRIRAGEPYQSIRRLPVNCFTPSPGARLPCTVHRSQGRVEGRPWPACRSQPPATSGSRPPASASRRSPPGARPVTISCSGSERPRGLTLHPPVFGRDRATRSPGETRRPGAATIVRAGARATRSCWPAGTASRPACAPPIELRLCIVPGRARPPGLLSDVIWSERFAWCAFASPSGAFSLDFACFGVVASLPRARYRNADCS